VLPADGNLPVLPAATKRPHMEAASKLSGVMGILTQPNILPSELPMVWWGDNTGGWRRTLPQFARYL